MDDEAPSAVEAALAMMRWRVDLLEHKLAAEHEARPGRPGLAEAADALRGFEIPASLVGRLLDEGISIGIARAEARHAAEREHAAAARASLRVVRLSG